MPQADFDWSLLPSADVLARLKHLRQAGEVAAPFLDTHQWCYLQEAPDLSLDGGHAAAQFRLAVLGAPLPSLACFRLAPPMLLPAPATAAQLRQHLHVRGLSCGDIHVAAGDIYIIATSEPVPALLAGATMLPAANWPEPDPRRATAASVRLDAVVSALFHVSRGEAQTAIEYDFVFLDFHPPVKPSQVVKAGSQIVYRTKGRAAILELTPNLRSGRLWVDYRFYPC